MAPRFRHRAEGRDDSSQDPAAPHVERGMNATPTATARSATKFHTVRVAAWPAIVGDPTEREAALKARDAIRRAEERTAYRAGCTHVCILNAWGDTTLDAWPIDTRRFAVCEGMRVEFPSKSVPGADGSRYGTAIVVENTRVRVQYRFKHGGESEKWVPRRLVSPARS